MLDKAKLKVFEEQGVRLVKTCGTCERSAFNGRSSWGECALAFYQHEKHDGLRRMPVHLLFWCPRHELTIKRFLELGEYADLVPDLTVSDLKKAL